MSNCQRCTKPLPGGMTGLCGPCSAMPFTIPVVLSIPANSPGALALKRGFAEPARIEVAPKPVPTKDELVAAMKSAVATARDEAGEGAFVDVEGVLINAFADELLKLYERTK